MLRVVCFYEATSGLLHTSVPTLTAHTLSLSLSLSLSFSRSFFLYVSILVVVSGFTTDCGSPSLPPCFPPSLLCVVAFAAFHGALHL